MIKNNSFLRQFLQIGHGGSTWRIQIHVLGSIVFGSQPYNIGKGRVI
jgi:hypothetical protein